MESFINIPASVLNDQRLSISDIRVYGALVTFAEGNTSCTPTQKEIQKVSGVQRVSRHNNNLLRCGHIHLVRHEANNRNTFTLIAFSNGNLSPEEITLSIFQKQYFDYAKGTLTIKTQKTYLSAYKEFVRIIGDLSLHSIGIRHIEKFLSTKKKEASEHTARKYYTSLRTAFEKAVQWEFITENPFSKVKKPKVPELSPVYLTEKEFTLLLSAIKEKDFRELCITGAGTGMRLGELLSLKWQEVDFDRKVIYVRNSETFKTKSKKNRVVPMNNELIRVLMEKKISLRSESETIFSDKRGKALLENTVSQKFKRAVRCAGLNDKLHFHSLRHSFASALVSSGVSLFIVSKFLGHSSSKTTEVYSHLSPLQFHREVNNGLRELFAGIGTN